MSLYDQRPLADANTDNYSTIVAFEEQEQHQQARTLQDSGYLSDHNTSDANVMVGGGGFNSCHRCCGSRLSLS